MGRKFVIVYRFIERGKIIFACVFLLADIYYQETNAQSERNINFGDEYEEKQHSRIPAYYAYFWSCV